MDSPTLSQHISKRPWNATVHNFNTSIVMKQVRESGIFSGLSNSVIEYDKSDLSLKLILTVLYRIF